MGHREGGAPPWCSHGESGLVLSRGCYFFFNQQFCYNYKKQGILSNLGGLELERDS